MLMAGGRYAENAKIEADILRDSWPPGQGGWDFGLLKLIGGNVAWGLNFL
jgi:hypothetical protein